MVTRRSQFVFYTSYKLSNRTIKNNPSKLPKLISFILQIHRLITIYVSDQKLLIKSFVFSISVPKLIPFVFVVCYMFLLTFPRMMLLFKPTVYLIHRNPSIFLRKLNLTCGTEPLLIYSVPNCCRSESFRIVLLHFRTVHAEMTKPSIQVIGIINLVGGFAFSRYFRDIPVLIVFSLIIGMEKKAARKKKAFVPRLIFTFFTNKTLMFS